MRRQTPARPDFPLTHHRNGQWCKKIKGKIHYFGTDKDKAVAEYLEQRDYLLAGQTPPGNCNTLGQLLDAFMGSKKQALDEGAISARNVRGI